MMTVIQDLLATAKKETPDQEVREVWAGIYFTGVWSCHLGIAATQSDVPCCFAKELDRAGQLHYRSAYELANLILSTNPLEVSVGMAALNSMIPINEQESVELNARDLILEHGRNKNIVMVGHFGFTETLRQSAKRLWVLELDPTFGDTPTDQAPDILPQADVIGITATTLLNHTFEGLSNMFPPHALVVMLGPTTPLSPVLFDYHIDVLAGSVVDDPLGILHLIGQGSPLHKPNGLRRFTLVRQSVANP
jgi:uncharacterized protein (DUF4213/DUF364 family)